MDLKPEKKEENMKILFLFLGIFLFTPLAAFAEEIGRYVPVTALNGSVTAIVDTATGDIYDTHTGKKAALGQAQK